MGKRLVVPAAIAVLVASAPLAVMAASGRAGGGLDRQRFGFTRGVITTRSTTFHNVPGATTGVICARGPLSAAVSVTTSGGAFALLVRVDDGPFLHPEASSDNPFGTNCWLAGADGSPDAVVVDPGFTPDRTLALLERAGKRLAAVLATHGHFDHIGSAAAVCRDEVPLYIHEEDRAALTDPAAWGAGFPVPPVPVDDVRAVVDGDVLEFAGFSIEVMHTPGHTPGSVCFA